MPAASRFASVEPERQQVVRSDARLLGCLDRAGGDDRGFHEDVTTSQSPRFMSLDWPANSHAAGRRLPSYPFGQ